MTGVEGWQSVYRQALQSLALFWANQPASRIAAVSISLVLHAVAVALTIYFTLPDRGGKLYRVGEPLGIAHPIVTRLVASRGNQHVYVQSEASVLGSSGVDVGAMLDAVNVEQVGEREHLGKRRPDPRAQSQALIALLEEEMRRDQPRNTADLVRAYSTFLRQAAIMYWRPPSGASEGLSARIQVELTPNGDIVNVRLVRSSGFRPFDRSVLHALSLVSRIPEFQALDSRVFERYFRRLSFIFYADGTLTPG